MAIAYENSTGHTIDWSSTITKALDAGVNADRCVLVFAMTDRGSATTISSATYGGVAMTAHTAFTTGGSGYDGRLFYLGGAASGSNNVVVTYSDGNSKPKIIAVAYSGVDTTTPVDQLANYNPGAGVTAPSATVTSAADDLVVLMCAYNGATSATPAAPATERFDAVLASAFYGFIWDEAGAASVTINGTLTSSEVWGAALNLNAASAGATGVPATNRFMMGVG